MTKKDLYQEKTSNKKLNGNIIFLDIDGVFTSARAQYSQPMRVWSYLDPTAIQFFNKISLNYDVGYVICSTWRQWFETKSLRHIFYGAGFLGEIVSSTNARLSKPNSVRDFVSNNGTKNWLAIDDEIYDWKRSVPDFFNDTNSVETDSVNGLLFEHMKKIDNIVKSW